MSKVIRELFVLFIIFRNQEAEHGVIAVPHGEIRIPNVIIEVEVQIFARILDTVLKQTSAVWRNKRTIKAFDCILSVSNAEIRDADCRAFGLWRSCVFQQRI